MRSESIRHKRTDGGLAVFSRPNKPDLVELAEDWSSSASSGIVYGNGTSRVTLYWSMLPICSFSRRSSCITKRQIYSFS